MGLFRNTEFKRLFSTILGISLFITVIGFLAGPRYGISFLLICLFFSVLIFISDYRRYKKIRAFSEQIDMILHGNSSFDITEYSEGELSVLQDELNKLVRRLNEQTDALKYDKVFLADSIADISHQIRTPLTSMNIILSFLSEPNLSESRRFELVSELRRFIASIDWLVNALLKMSRLDAGTANLKIENVSVEQLLENVKNMLEIPIELRGQQLSISIKGMPVFKGDFSWSSEALANIVKNCMEHTPEGGTISITASRNPIFTEILVQDTGCGISPDDLPHLFERFYKGKDSSEQSIGIGLALARMIITEQNGTIKAENLKAGGALFTVRFYNGAV